MVSLTNSWKWAYILGWRPLFYFFYFWSLSQISWKFAHFLRWRSEFVNIRVFCWDTTFFFFSLPQILSNFAMNTFFFGPHSRIQGNKVFVPPKVCLCPPPPVMPSWSVACRICNCRQSAGRVLLIQNLLSLKATAKVVLQSNRLMMTSYTVKAYCYDVFLIRYSRGGEPWWYWICKAIMVW